MSCTPAPTFRLLDRLVGWDVAQADASLGGFDDAEGILLLAPPGELDAADVLPRFLPPRLAQGRARGDWLIAPDERNARLLRLGWRKGCDGACERRFEPWGPPLRRPIAVAAGTRFVAALDAGAGEVVVLDAAGRIAGRIGVRAPRAVAVTPWGELLVASGRDVLRFGPGGDARGRLHSRPAGRVVAMATDTEERIWVLSRWRTGGRDAWGVAAFRRDGAALLAPTEALLAAALPPTAVAVWGPAGFFWAGDGPVAPCLSWSGAPLDPASVPAYASAPRAASGSFTTLALDGGEDGTVWHRVRLDADVPVGTRIAVEAATVDDPAEPIPADGWSAQAPAQDLLLVVPPGRYLRLRLTLAGTGGRTSRLRQVRVDFPRATSADLLPAVYRKERVASDFTDRFLSLFDAELDAVDRVIERFPSLVFPVSAPDAALPWLGQLLGMAFDLELDAPHRRALLLAAPELWRLRGTPRGLSRALELVLGVAPAIVEERLPSGAVARGRCRGPDPVHARDARARLGHTRLFGRRRRRFRLDRSVLGQGALRSYGNPDADPVAAVAYRFSVLFPPGGLDNAHRRERARALVDALRPAHAVATVRFGGHGFVLGTSSAAGVDTCLAPLPAPLLGVTTRLCRATVLWASDAARGGGTRAGAVALGLNPTL
jgi:phage tail-like protein